MNRGVSFRRDEYFDNPRNVISVEAFMFISKVAIYVTRFLQISKNRN